jgi:Icc protein
MSQDSYTLAQLTDIHLFADPARSLMGVDTEQSFSTVFATLQKDKRTYQSLVLSGDLSQDGSLLSYQRLSQTLAQLSYPCYFLPGNHDDCQQINIGMQGINISPEKYVALNAHWQMILLNSVKPGHIAGELSDEQFVFLETHLNKSSRHTLIFIHHNAFLNGADWLAPHALQQPEKFISLLGKHPHVQGVVCGHIHHASEYRHQHIRFISTPSTCFQFRADQHHFGLADEAPGYRWFHLHADGQFDSGVVRVEAAYQQADPSQKGY